MRIAVADMGTNSTRLLVADVDGQGGLREIERLTRVTRLGQGVDQSGRLADEAIERVLAALAEYRRVADGYNAERSIAIATSAVRDAANGDELTNAAQQQHGFDTRTISGDEEARLTFLGATSKRAAADSTGPTDPLLVIDIGGGSTELVTGTPGSGPTFHVSTRLGSVRQTERHLHDDPPAHHQLEALAQEAKAILVEGAPEQIRAATTQGIAVAGTPTSLAAIDQELDPYDPAKVDGYTLRRAACERMLALLAELPLDKRKAVTGLHPERAPTIVAGVVILVEAMRLFGLEEIEVSEADILDGAALDHARR